MIGRPPDALIVAATTRAGSITNFPTMTACRQPRVNLVPSAHRFGDADLPGRGPLFLLSSLPLGERKGTEGGFSPSVFLVS